MKYLDPPYVETQLKSMDLRNVDEELYYLNLFINRKNKDTTWT